MDSYKFQKLCKEYLVEYFKERYKIETTIEDFYVVWSCKTLKNNKVLVSTDKVNDGFYCEFTRNGEKKETFCDIYYKSSNRVLDI